VASDNQVECQPCVATRIGNDMGGSSLAMFASWPRKHNLQETMLGVLLEIVLSVGGSI
jgi:hypothetical protein